MESNISSRIELILNEFGLNKNSFSKKIGITNNVTIGRILNEDRKPSYDVLKRIIENFTEINSYWLLTGEGEMLNEYKNSYSKEKQLKKEVEGERAPFYGSYITSTITGSFDEYTRNTGILYRLQAVERL